MASADSIGRRAVRGNVIWLVVVVVVCGGGLPDPTQSGQPLFDAGVPHPTSVQRVLQQRRQTTVGSGRGRLGRRGVGVILRCAPGVLVGGPGVVLTVTLGRVEVDAAAGTVSETSS